MILSQLVRQLLAIFLFLRKRLLPGIMAHLWKNTHTHTAQSRIIGAVRGPTFNYGGQLSLYVLHILSVNMTKDLAHLQLSDLQGEIIPICRMSDLQGKRMLICRT